MDVEKQIKSFQSKLKVKAIIIEDKVGLLNGLNPSVDVSLVKLHDQQLDELIQSFDSLTQDFQVLLISNVPAKEVETTISELRKTKNKLEGLVFLCRDNLRKAFDLSDRHANIVEKPVVNMKMPQLKIQTFSDNSGDLFAFESFRSSFLNAMSSFPSITNIEKMIYLKSSLTGQALSLVDHMKVDDSSFDQAWELLESEYFDVEFIVDSVLDQILNYAYCNGVDHVISFNTFLKSKVLNLSKLGYRFENNTSGDLLLSKIIRSKLPKFILQELSRKTGDSFPSVKQILGNLIDICKLHHKTESTSFKNYGSSSSSQTKYNNKTEKKLENNFVKLCKFCGKDKHSSTRCDKYRNYNERKRRAIEMGLCVRCLGKYHKGDACRGVSNELPYPCSICKRCDHVTPMCANMVMSLSSEKEFKSRD